MNILVLEPYFGGSHRSFLEGLARHLPFEFAFLTLPARKWKWRMRLAAPCFAQLMQEMEPPDRVLCSTFVDVATLRALAPAWIRQVPVLTYFHENQFAYPVQVDDERDFHFALTNYTTALASDRLAFNSAYNLDSFVHGATEILKKAPDMKMDSGMDALRARATVLPPGLEFADIDGLARPEKKGPPAIVWNHRWEHDKNPEEFFTALETLDRMGLDFSLIMLGQSFSRQPEIFARARRKLGHRIRHWGYVKERQEYVRWLKQGDLVVSTAWHEFYGIAVIEAVRAGCRPLLPDRLSYPELFPGEYLFQEGELVERLAALVKDPAQLSPARARELSKGFSWQSLVRRYQAWFQG